MGALARLHYHTYEDDLVADASLLHFASCLIDSGRPAPLWTVIPCLYVKLYASYRLYKRATFTFYVIEYL